MSPDLIPPTDGLEETPAPSVMVKMEHVRAAAMCSRGARAFFLQHGLDWNTFLKEGLPSEVLEGTGDAMAKQVVEVARGRTQ